MGQFFRRWILHTKSFRLIDWLIDDKLTLTWLVYWIRTARSVFTGAGLKVFFVCLRLPQKSVPMSLVTCWKYEQNDIFISSRRNEPSQLQNCRTKRFLTVFGTLLVTWQQRQEILSPAHPAHPAHPVHPKTEYVLPLFLQIRTFHSVWYVRQCTALTVVPKYGPHPVHWCFLHVNNALS